MIKIHILVFIGAIILILISPVSGLLTSPDLMEVAQDSDLILSGKILAVQSAWNKEKTNIITTVQVQPGRAAKGTLSPGSIILTVPGGSVDGITEWVEDMPAFRIGDTRGFFLKRRDNRYELSSPLGQISLNDAAYPAAAEMAVISGEVVSIKPMTEDQFISWARDLDKGISMKTTAERELPHIQSTEKPSISSIKISTMPNLRSVRPSSGSAGTKTLISLIGTGFGPDSGDRDVAFLYRLKGEGWMDPIYASGRPNNETNQDSIISWNDTAISVYVPEGITSDGYPGSASSGFIQVVTHDLTWSNAAKFAVPFSYANLSWRLHKVGYYINNQTMTRNFTQAIISGANTWNAAGANFIFEYKGNTTRRSGLKDGYNVISSAPLGSSRIGEAGIWSYENGTIDEADFTFNNRMNFTAGTAGVDEFNIRAITIHELGHWLFLKDLYGWLAEFSPMYKGWPSDLSPNKKIMFGYNNQTFGNKNVITLTNYEKAGIQWIYGKKLGVQDKTGMKSLYQDPSRSRFMIIPASINGIGSIKFDKIQGHDFLNGSIGSVARSF